MPRNFPELVGTQGPYGYAIAEILWAGIGHTTRSGYHTAQRAYEYLCSMEGTTAWPATKETLAVFITVRANGSTIGPLKQIKPATIERYLYALQSYHTDRDWPTDMFHTLYLKRLLSGIKSIFRSKKAERLPITMALLQRMTAYRVVEPVDANFRASFLMGYAGFFRAGEFTYEAKHLEDMAAFKASRLCRSDVSFAADWTNMVITLRASKTDIEHQGVKIYIAATPHRLNTCPVFAMRALFQLDPQEPGHPLFHVNDSCFSRTKFVANMQARIASLNLNPRGYTAHSVRKGAAQDAADNGCLSSEIQILGRWTSEAFKLYYTISATKRFELNRQFQMGEVPSR